jgi:hypothetical protein
MKFPFLLLSLSISVLTFCQQIPDTTFLFQVESRIVERNLVYVDAAHSNFHTIDNRFLPFAKLVRSGGFEVVSSTQQFSQESLTNCDILVIANANHPDNNPESGFGKSAFAEDEIIAVEKWVSDGGSLLLIADHMPFSGAASELAAAFGFQFNDGFAFQRPQTGIFSFSKEDQGLGSHQITNNLESIWTFTGQAFTIPDSSISLMSFDERHIQLLPEIPWQFTEDTPLENISGMSQGAILNYGDGKVAMFGEAAMFTAQLAGPNQFKAGFNYPEATDNWRFILNLLYWLAGD